MRILQRTSVKIVNCTKCLLHYVQWSWLLLFTCLSGLFYYYIVFKYISTASTVKEAIYYFYSCPSNNNALLVICFYLVTFIPVIFEIRFWDYKICAEYYVTRVCSQRKFLFSKMLSSLIISLVNVTCRLLLFILCNKIFCPNLVNKIIDSVHLWIVLLTVSCTFNFAILGCYFFIRNAIVVFIMFSVLFLFSLYYSLNISSWLFWLYGLNLYNLKYCMLLWDLIFIITIMFILLIRPHDIIIKEEDKNE